MIVLWIISVALVVLVVVAVVWDPARGGPEPALSDLEATMAKASTYYEFEHYERAAETYAMAAERGMVDPVEWYHYAHSLELSSGLNLEIYLTAYRRLLERAPNHEYMVETERIVSENSVEFDYESARSGAYPAGTLVTITGSITRVIRGRIASGTDTLFVDTAPDIWLSYLGNPVLVTAPRSTANRVNNVVRLIGWYDEWCSIDDEAGTAAEYPCVSAAGVRLAQQ